jgi:4-amino-4-deoxy-L-arabinose transferase-like glycosyltransferase
MGGRKPDWAIAALLLLVAPGLALVLPAPSSDTRELLSWGLHPALSTPKQPPLMQWMGFLVMRLAWPTTFWCALLTQALNGAGLFYVYKTLRLWSGAAEAALMTLLLASAVYFLGSPVAFALNADILQFPFWAAMLFYALAAFETGKGRYWAGLAVAFALAFYAKYTVALLVVSLAAASLLVPAYRRVWRERRLYLTAAAAALLIAPHLLAARHSGAVGHATGTLLLSGGLAYRLKNLSELALGFLAYLAPAWIFLATAGLRREWRGAPAPEPAAQFVRATAATALLLLLVLVLGLGFKYPSRYDSPFLFLAWLTAASYVRFDPARLPVARLWLLRAAGGFAAALLLGGWTVYGLFTLHPRQQEPLARAAEILTQEWRARYACGPAYVMGDFWSAYGIGVSMVPPRPGVHLIEIEGDPGYDPALRARDGAILIYRDHIDAREAHAVFPDLDLASPQRLTLPFARTLSRKATITYEYVFIPPKGC